MYVLSAVVVTILLLINEIFLLPMPPLDFVVSPPDEVDNDTVYMSMKYQEGP
jgi:hypothetical protein